MHEREGISMFGRNRLPSRRVVMVLMLIGLGVLVGGGSTLIQGPSSAAAGPLCPAEPPTNTAAPTISPSGTVTNATTLTSTTGSWSSCGLPITGFLYQWQSSTDGSTWTN